MSVIVRFEVEVTFDPSDDVRNDLEIVAEAIELFLLDHQAENVKVKPCHVESLEREE